ncbi:MAG TPA: fused MFS/spermidine synthase [Candidatus Saccharimonadales bacterium]|jgi:predicted membrane-bound spermidine synthase|nr:fused MFS/spermidine synthase [Candidatus Saccharimonadales bacterium]
MKMIKLPILPIIAFVSGFSLMTFELAAARVLAPNIGSSTYVWTSVIGVIIAALSLGYWAGGKLADIRNRAVDLAWLCLAIAAAITLTLLNYQNLIESIVQSIEDSRVQGIVASLVLFAPASFLIGMLSPYLVKLRVTSLATSGQSFASLSALESIGGITGTFITGFVLFGYIGAREAFVAVILLLLASSWLIVPHMRWRGRMWTSLVIIVMCVGSLQMTNKKEIDTASAHYTIFDAFTRSGQPVRGIATGPGGTQSGIAVGQPDELVFWYTQQMAEVVASVSQRDRILILGGGAFTLPQYLANKYPDSTIDVVEIDPELATIAREHFEYKDPKNVNMIFEDARTYVNRSTQKYGIILVDVYSDSSVPFSLMTREYGQRIQRLLTDEGVIVVNMIANTTGPCRELLIALDAPYSLGLPHAAYKTNQPNETKSNMIVTYSKQPLDWAGSFPLTIHTPAIYTDNYAPAERLQQKCQNAA